MMLTQFPWFLKWLRLQGYFIMLVNFLGGRMHMPSVDVSGIVKVLHAVLPNWSPFFVIFIQVGICRG